MILRLALALILSCGLSAAAAPCPPQGKTRAEVRAEAREALRKGEFMANGETLMKANQQVPGRYPVQSVN